MNSDTPSEQDGRHLQTVSAGDVTRQERTELGAVDPAADRDRAFYRFQELQNAARRRSRLLSLLGLGLAFLPTLITAFYVFFIATPMYSAESRFAIRSSESAPTPPGLGGAFGGGMGGGGALAIGFVDGYAARDFVESREAMDRLRTKLDLGEMFRRRGLDPWSGAPAGASEDRLYDAYRSLVSVRYNMIEQTIVLDATTFSPADSTRLAKGIVGIVEEFADQLNRRAREDALRVAQEEVTKAEQRSERARLAITEWRMKTGNIDPLSEVTIISNVIGQLEGELAAAENDLARIDASGSSNHPRRGPAELLVKTLRERIKELRARIAGSNSQQLSIFETLKIAQEFAEANLSNARQSLEQAKVALLRQQKFVAMIVEPHADRRPTHPRPFRSIGIALLFGLAAAFFGSALLGLLRTRLLKGEDTR